MAPPARPPPGPPRSFDPHALPPGAPARPPPPRLPPREEPPQQEIPTEWARRAVGPPEEGRVRGLCSGCNSALSISMQRPVKVACPVCGRTKLLA